MTARRPKIVLLGMLTKIPVGGVAWLVGQYATGFQRLGYDVYYVEAHARTPSMFMTHADDDATANAAAFLETTMTRFGMKSKWAFHALHDDGRYVGMTERQIRRLYRDAALIINLHGGTLPLDEHIASGRLVYLGTDPVEVELEIERGDKRAIEFLDQHIAHFTWGLNYGNADCPLPWTTRYTFVPSPPPVVLDFWDRPDPLDTAAFTTIGNWRQVYRDVDFEGRTFAWSKHQQFDKVIDLPARVAVPMELALASFEPSDQARLEGHGWRVRPGFELSRDLDAYRDYIAASAGEFSVAKEQNVHFRSGWFSERSATYLAAGRPVIVQDTGFPNALPTGAGLFAFDDLDEAAAAVEEVASHPQRHRRAAREVAREFLNYDVVLGSMLDHLGLPSASTPTPRRFPAPEIPPDLALTPRSRRPLVLADPTVSAAVGRPIPAVTPRPGAPDLSVIVVVLDNLACTRLTLESVLANTDAAYEIVVVDNGSGADTRRYLGALSARNHHVRVLRNDANIGFAGGVNQGLAAARGSVLVLLNNDTIVTAGALADLAATVADGTIGLAGPATNRCGNAAEVLTTYATHGELVDFAAHRRASTVGPFDIPVAVMFCTAMRRDVVDAVGPLDEQFEVGMFEDDDYAHRVRAAGFRVVCDDDVFVHHFGEATIGSLGDAYGSLFAANQARFEAKWGVAWHPHERRPDAQYDALVAETTRVVTEVTPAGAVVAVVSHGDDRLLKIPGRVGWHFPRTGDGRYAGHHPASGQEAIAGIEATRATGAAFLAVPAPSRWWLDHYAGLREHLERYDAHEADGVVTIYTLGGQTDAAGTAADVTPSVDDVASRPDAAEIWACRYLVERHVPVGATVAVVAKDDPAFLTFPGRRAVNFPRGADGRYPGYTFEDGSAAVAGITAQRVQGASFLLIPDASRWWVDRYPELSSWVERHGHLVVDQPGAGILAALEPADRTGDPTRAERSLASVLDGLRDGDRPLAVANWTDIDLPAAAARGNAVIPAARYGDGLAYVDASVDVVVIDRADRRSEAERVASLAVITLERDDRITAVRVGGQQQPESSMPSPAVVLLGDDDGGWRESIGRSPFRDDIVIMNANSWSQAAACDREFVAIVEPGVVPLPGCLEAAVATLVRRPRAAAVGVKLFAADGTIDSAGTTVFNDGTFAGIANGTAKVTEPWHDYVRPIHAATGVVVARTPMLREVDPQPPGVSPMSFVAWCAALWSSGAEVLYQPDASAVRARAVSAATSEEHDTLLKLLTPVLDARSARPDPLDDRSWRMLIARDDVTAGWR